MIGKLLIILALSTNAWAQPGDLHTVTKDIPTAGSRVQLSSTTLLVSEVTIQAKTGNGGVVYVGGSDVNSTLGWALAAGASFSISGIKDSWAISKPPVRIDLSRIYVDTSNSGDDIIFAYIER